MTFSTTITARAVRVLRPDHIRAMLAALAAWRALPAASRANLVASLERDDLSDEGQAAAELLKAITAAVTRKVKP